MKTKMTVALIYGSARPGRFCDVVADWVVTHLPEMMAADILIVDPADLAAESRNGFRVPVLLRSMLHGDPRS